MTVKGLSLGRMEEKRLERPNGPPIDLNARLRNIEMQYLSKQESIKLTY